ncbi:hypothetical protein CG747_33720 [Streptomyces sp. CB02959]|uniref:VC0807 family protein n=1 Tax=Streptomyces sp. CB02959 TaxID=2020330 RepID=UPI000CACC2C7|nr:VC0807 family protein [Streptomyces sp. CB02959]PJN36340.1 hypothetical protein CG747_33720 [Streptomyces sp. CB02959]
MPEPAGDRGEGSCPEAIEAIADLGLHRASLAEIARRAGLTKQAIFYHFATRDELIHEVLAVVTQHGAEFMAARARRAPTPADELRAYIEANVEYLGSHRERVKALVAIAMNFTDEDGRSRLLPLDASVYGDSLAPLRDILQRGQEQGQFAEFDTRTTAMSIRAAIDAIGPPPSGTRAWTALALDVAVPLAVFYGSRAAGVDQWLALVLAGIAPLAGVLTTWARQRRADPTALFVIAAMVLSVLVAMVTGDPRALLARESWVTAALGLWILGSLAMTRPFLLDVAVKVTPAGTAQRLDRLWHDAPAVRRWIQVASAAWGSAFLLDAIARVVMAYTLPVDSVPSLGVVVLVVLLSLAQALVMLHGRRSGALALMRGRA